MKTLILLIVSLILIQFSSFGQGVLICNPNPEYYLCDPPVNCPQTIHLDCGDDFTVECTYQRCLKKASGIYYCTFAINSPIESIPLDCRIYYQGNEHQLFDAIMDYILLHIPANGPCGSECLPHRPGCGDNNFYDFYVASCWHWGTVNPDGCSDLIPCEQPGCCQVFYQLCMDNNGNLYTLPPTHYNVSLCPLNQGKGCFTICTDE